MSQQTETAAESAAELRLSAQRVHDLIKDCVFRDEEWLGEMSRQGAPEGAVFAEGLVNTFGFHPGRLAEHKAEIATLLAELPDEFQVKGGRGWTFLNACMDRHGRQWGEHPDIEALVCLGIATGQARWMMKEKADVLPGGVPYFQVGESA